MSLNWGDSHLAPKSRSWRILNEAFDPDSGQVYTETIVPARRNNASWVWSTLGRPEDVRTHQHPQAGVPRLVDVATCTLVANINMLTPESFEGVPWSVAERIWQRVTKL